MYTGKKGTYQRKVLAEILSCKLWCVQPLFLNHIYTCMGSVMAPYKSKNHDKNAQNSCTEGDCG